MPSERTCLVVLALWSLAGVAFGDAVVVPNACATSPGPSNNSIPFDGWDPMRFQQVYAAGQFGGRSGIITQIAYRVDESEGGEFVANPFDVDIWLSHTARQPQQLSDVFDENSGPDKTLVYSGALALSSAGTGAFDIVIDINDVFTYDGAQNLLLEVQITGGYAGCGSFDAAGLSVGEGGSPETDRLYAYGIGTETGVSDGDDGLVTQFTFVPEPSALLLLLAGATWRRH